MGTKNGYQFIWKEATAKVKAGVAQFTYLNGDRFYTISSLVKDSANVFLTRVGANDPSFNLRREPAYIIRTQAVNPVFVNVIEMHGKYDTRNEFSTDAYSSVKNIELVQQDENYTVARIQLNEKTFLIVLCNKDYVAGSKHQLQIGNTNYEWTGPYLFKASNNK